MESIKSITGKLIKSVGGLFHVEIENNKILQCTARGLFRLQNISPVAGDNVEVEINEDDAPLITDVLPRKNHIVRPPLANLDAAVIVISTTQPPPNKLILDKLIAIFESKEIEPVLLITKTDISEGDRLAQVYEKAGFKLFSVSNTSGAGIAQLRQFLTSDNSEETAKVRKTIALIGNTGVGKSSTLNSLFPELALDTAEISKKLGRGKHTTRQVELYRFKNVYIADTPGFSTVEAAKYGELPSTEVAACFREFVPFLPDCKFAGCRHIKEEGCGIIAAKERGEITQSRFESYTKIFEDAFLEERRYN